MNSLRVQIDQHGRLLLPSKFRKDQNIKSGDVFVMRVINGEIRLLSIDKVVDKVRKLFTSHSHKKEDVVDEFLQYRREQAALEQKKYDAWGKRD